MTPAVTRSGKTAASPRTRLTCIEMVHGAAGSTAIGRASNYWSPAEDGANFELTYSLRSLEPFRQRLTVISDTELKNAMSLSPEENGDMADHARSSAVFLTGAHPRMAEGKDIHAGPSIDQVYAQHCGRETRLASIQLCIEDLGSFSGVCGHGYGCAYSHTISWASPTMPLPMERAPRAVFDQLFASVARPAKPTGRRQVGGSILDGVTGGVAGLRQGLGPSDRRRLAEYFEDVRQVERRIQQVEKDNSSGQARDIPEAPVSVPDSFEEHVNLMFDLQALAFMTDLTRVSAFKMGVDRSQRVYPKSGVTTPFHTLSHHRESPERIKEFAQLNEYHVSRVAYFLDRLRNTPDGGGTLLDHSLVLYGSPMGDSHVHAHTLLPLFLAGGASGALKGNLHRRCSPGTPMANVLLTVLRKLGVDTDGIGDSTAEVAI